MRKSLICLFLLAALPAYAAPKKAAPAPVMAASPQLEKCLKRADELPDMAAAESLAWSKKGGGYEARLCHAFAQSNRGMHAEAGKEFWDLASLYDRGDLRRAVLMHNMSGREYLRAKDVKNASAQYAYALMIAPKDVMSLTGRAEAYMAEEKYWDALADLNKALKLKPNNPDALRQRGRAWMQLGDSKNAQQDFAHAAVLSGDK